MNYIKKAFRFGHLNQARLGDSAHIHVYKMHQADESSPFRLELDARFSTDANGVAESLGLPVQQYVTDLQASELGDAGAGVVGGGEQTASRCPLQVPRSGAARIAVTCSRVR